MKNSNKPRNLIWLCPKSKKAIGGVKIIYRQASLVEEFFSENGLNSYVVHPNSGKYRATWFESNTKVKPMNFGFRWTGKISRSDISFSFNHDTDVVILPEMWASKFGPQLRRNRIPYAIYVQNGYQINSGPIEDLEFAYAGAAIIMAISEDARRCIKAAFPNIKTTIKRIHYSIDENIFKFHKDKEKVITYMPRKLSNHSDLVLFFLKSRLPPDWRIEKIEGLPETDVGSLLKKSSIFMSFSSFEGCPLPPLEAGLAGNIVVGYTGQGGREYWQSEIYHLIEEGDVVGFSEKVLEIISALDRKLNISEHHRKVLDLGRPFSKQSELSDIQEVLSHLDLI